MINFLKTIVIWVFAAGIIYVTMRWQGHDSFIFAWVLNMMLMLGVSYSIQTYEPGLGSTYYDAKSWEDRGRIYRWVGIDAFRNILVWIGWEKLNKASNPVNKHPATLKKLEYSSRQSELGHLIIFGFVAALALFIALRYGIAHTLWLLILNIILNLYPVILQRYNRPRLQNILIKAESFGRRSV